MAGEVEKGVIVSEEAAVGLAHYLTEIGRLGNRTARDVAAAIQSTCNTQWGMASVKQFRDNEGVGWIVDLSEKFNDEVLYAIVRSEKGERRVATVVDEDKLKLMFPGAPQKKPETPSGKSHLDEMPSQESMGIDPDNPSGPTLAQQRDHLKAVAQKLKGKNEVLTAELSSSRRVDPVGPALVRWKKKATKADSGQGFQGFEGDETRISIGEVEDEIHRLIETGVKPEHIEVWSKRQIPKVRVELE